MSAFVNIKFSKDEMLTIELFFLLSIRIPYVLSFFVENLFK